MTTTEGEKFMEEFRRGYADAVRGRIARGELLTQEALHSKLGVPRHELDAAVRSDRLFAISGPDDSQSYYPAFYADPTLDRRAIERVSKALGTLSGPIKYDFFTNRSFSLSATPLDALRAGELSEVLALAFGRSDEH